jgi:hypothetical protein
VSGVAAEPGHWHTRSPRRRMSRFSASEANRAACRMDTGPLDENPPRVVESTWRGFPVASRGGVTDE